MNASDDFRRGAITAAEYRDKLEQQRRRLDKLKPPDDDWRSVLKRLRDDLSRTVAQVDGTSARSREEIHARRARFRASYTGLVRRRLNFWR